MDQRAAPIRLSLAAIPAANRLAVLNDVHGAALDMTFEPTSDELLRLDCELWVLPGVSVIQARNSPMTSLWRRDARGHDGFELNWSPSRGPGRLRQCGREVDSGIGYAVLTGGQDPVHSHMGAGLDPIQVRIDRAALATMVPDVDDRAMRPIAPDTPALQLLTAYLAALPASAPDATLAATIATHIADLTALAIGASRDGAEFARRRGAAAARLAAIKRWTDRHLRRPDLSIATVAAAHGVTARTVQKLFAAEGGSFSSFVLAQRLALARSDLADPIQAGRTIGAIAFDAGFGDLSYFNRCFRAAYGETPSDLRERARRADASL